MTSSRLAPLQDRISASFAGGVRTVRSAPLLSRATLLEIWSAYRGGHAVNADHRPHAAEAAAWLARAQDATADDGFARGYGLVWSSHFRSRGWQPSYPETTGYIIPTLLSAARWLGSRELVGRALRAARWESAVQMESGAVQGGVIGDPQTPAVFNTGQVIFGWLAALKETGEENFELSARRAADYLTRVQEADGLWRKGNSRYARSDATLYNARTAWALAEAGARLNEPLWRDAAARNLRAVAAQQAENGWFPNCCLYDPGNPLLHTLAYTVRGLVEGGRVLEDEHLLHAGARAAEALAATVRADGWMPGRFGHDWAGAASWSCLTGQAQIANIWLRLFEITGERRWLEKVSAVLAFLKRTQNRSTPVEGLRGGIRGSEPVSGEYGRFEVLNWATKFFLDALMRHADIGAGMPVSRVSPLA